MVVSSSRVVPGPAADGWNPPTALATSSRRVVASVGASSVIAADVAVFGAGWRMAADPRTDTARAAEAPSNNRAGAAW
jgi:hypothetical protein